MNYQLKQDLFSHHTNVLTAYLIELNRNFDYNGMLDFDRETNKFLLIFSDSLFKVNFVKWGTFRTFKKLLNELYLELCSERNETPKNFNDPYTIDLLFREQLKDEFYEEKSIKIGNNKA